MPEHVWTIACRRVLVDESTKVSSFIDVLEGFEYFGTDDFAHAAGFPIELAIITLWARSDPAKEEVAKHRLTIVGPKMPPEDPKALPEATIDLTAVRFHRTTFAFQGFPNYGDGDYSILIDLLEGDQWKTVKTLTITVNRRLTPQV
jgi:hypothetical protein